MAFFIKKKKVENTKNKKEQHEENMSLANQYLANGGVVTRYERHGKEKYMIGNDWDNLEEL